MLTRPARSRLAAAALTALALTGTALTTAVTTGTADAATVAHARDAAARKAPHVTVTVTKKAVKVSGGDIAPGNTIVDIVGRSGGSLEVMQLHDGYTLDQLQQDFPGVFQGDVEAINRVDKGVEFYGGSMVHKGSKASIATFLDPGRYLLANLDKGTFTWMELAGPPEDRALPKATGGTVDFVGESKFGNPGKHKHRGWMSTTNKTDEPHFADLSQVKGSVTKKQVRKYFATGNDKQPSWIKKGYAGTLVIGPGHTTLWKFKAPKGKYLEACWWPSDEDGMPHALMGMWALTRLR